jgi:hypothetical protein
MTEKGEQMKRRVLFGLFFAPGMALWLAASASASAQNVFICPTPPGSIPTVSNADPFGVGAEAFGLNGRFVVSTASPLGIVEIDATGTALTPMPLAALPFRLEPANNRLWFAGSLATTQSPAPSWFRKTLGSNFSDYVPQPIFGSSVGFLVGYVGGPFRTVTPSFFNQGGGITVTPSGTVFAFSNLTSQILVFNNDLSPEGTISLPPGAIARAVVASPLAGGPPLVLAVTDPSASRIELRQLDGTITSSLPLSFTPTAMTPCGDEFAVGGVGALVSLDYVNGQLVQRKFTTVPFTISDLSCGKGGTVFYVGSQRNIGVFNPVDGTIQNQTLAGTSDFAGVAASSCPGLAAVLSVAGNQGNVSIVQLPSSPIFSVDRGFQTRELRLPDLDKFRGR